MNDNTAHTLNNLKVDENVTICPTDSTELERSWKISKYSRTLFLPKSIISEVEPYEVTLSSPRYFRDDPPSSITITRHKFTVPQWFVDKNSIQHWDDNGVKSVSQIKAAIHKIDLLISEFKEVRDMYEKALEPEEQIEV
jgi:hypothetical protein